jgi:hypothetical protein
MTCSQGDSKAELSLQISTELMLSSPTFRMVWVMSAIISEYVDCEVSCRVPFAATCKIIKPLKTSEKLRTRIEIILAILALA